MQKSARLKTQGASLQLSFTMISSEGSPPSSGSPPPEPPPPGNEDENTTNDYDNRPPLQSTYCATMVQHCEALNRSVQVVNLDPAAEHFNYSVMAGKF